MNRVLIIFVLFACICFSNCGVDILQEDFNTKRILWESENISDYTFSYNKTCFCLLEDDIVATVVNNTIVSAHFSPSGIEITGSELNNVMTINDFFDLVQALFDDGTPSINIKYNTDYNFPDEISVDPFPDSIDDEYTYRLKDFTI